MTVAQCVSPINTNHVCLCAESNPGGIQIWSKVKENNYKCLKTKCCLSRQVEKQNKPKQQVEIAGRIRCCSRTALKHTRRLHHWKCVFRSMKHQAGDWKLTSVSLSHHLQVFEQICQRQGTSLLTDAETTCQRGTGLVTHVFPHSRKEQCNTMSTLEIYRLIQSWEHRHGGFLQGDVSLVRDGITHCLTGGKKVIKQAFG